MSSTAIYLLLLPPVFLFTIWHLISAISPPPVPENLTNKRIILLIAHPDDESMFFSPTVQSLTRPELGNHMKILCMSTGDSEGLGDTRKKELEKAAVTLGLRRKEDVFIMNDKRFKDGLKEEWDEKEIARVLAQAFAPQLIPGSATQHARTASGVDLETKYKKASSSVQGKSGGQNGAKSQYLTPKAASSTTMTDLREVTAPPEGPRASIDVLLTFDATGVSGHPNHKSLYHGSRVFLQQLMKDHAGYSCPIALYTLTSSNILRKYSFILDVMPTYLINICATILENMKSKNKGPKERQHKKDGAVFINDIPRYWTAREAMVRGHKSQMVWFRWGWISLGRYMVLNDLRREHVYDCKSILLTGINHPKPVTNINMPGRVTSSPHKRVLNDATNTHNNVKSPPSAKKRKLNDSQSNGFLNSSQGGPNGSRFKMGSSQPKSQFETEVLAKMTQDISDLKRNNAEKDQQWDRPPLDDFDPKRDSLCFQQIEVEEGTLHGGRVTLKLFGVSETGHSILLHVTDFLHYLYVAAPVNFTTKDLEGYKAFLETQMAQHQPVIHSVQMLRRENLYGFQGNQKSPYLKVTVTDPKHINKLRTLIEGGNANFKGFWKGVDGRILTFDNIQYVLRFMIDTGITGMSWVQVPKEKYTVMQKYDRQSNCQIEAYCHYRDLISLGHDGEWTKMAPLRILSFDIECAGRKGVFPEPDQDPVIQIANVVTRYGEEKPFIRNVFVLDTCSLIVNTQIYEHDSEEKMLMGWRDFLEKVDPDVIIGYNISNFDFPYLLDRAKHLKLTKFPYWTRLPSVQSAAKQTNFSSKQMGNRDTQATNTNGRIQLDLLQLVQRDHHLRSYTLNSVSAHFLGEQKEDVHHTMITELFNGTPDSRRRLAVYCLKDAYLPQRLMDKLMCLVNYTEMARVTGVPFNYLLSRGQQVKFISQLFRKALEQQLVIPNLRNESTDEQYEGATVIEPIRGYYDVPVATLDFASLYPSIMQAHNLCYTTLLNKQSVERLNLVKDEDYIVTPNGDLFCTAKVRKGLLTQILEELLGARKRAKRELAVETDPFKKAVLNGRQLALKISANSVYGLTGATVGKLPCLAIASSTTSYGRQMIEKTKQEVEAKYKIANGYSHDAQVIYGDTDSVMVKFGEKDLQKTMELGAEAAEYVSSKFIKPIKLEFEKIYFPYLLINKKRYAGLYWTKPEKYDKMDTKGIETVRRDNCRLVQIVIETVLKKILIDRDVDGAQDYVKQTISSLLQNKVDLSMLVITKALTKREDAYEGKQAHVELAERMRKRDAGSAPTLGDRVAYVIVKGAAGSKNFEKSEDPLYVLEHNVPIDTKYYLDNQLANPLGRIFEPILGEKRANSLLTGEHTRSIAVSAPSMVGLMKFAKKTQTCMGCKKPLVSAHEAKGAVCENCRPRIGELYTKQVTKVGELEVRFGRLWTQCQRCQGSMHSEVLCSSKDCPIFYMRMKARKEVEEGHKELGRFDNDIGATW